MLLSKTPIISSRLHVFPKLAAVSHFNMDVGALEGVIQTSGGAVRFYSIHLSHLTSRERVMQINFSGYSSPCMARRRGLVRAEELWRRRLVRGRAVAA